MFTPNPHVVLSLTLPKEVHVPEQFPGECDGNMLKECMQTRVLKDG